MPQPRVWIQLEQRPEVVGEISLALQAALKAADPVYVMSQVVKKRGNSLVVGGRT